MHGQKIISATRNFLKSYNFSKGLLLASAVFAAISVSLWLFNVSVASGAALGVLIISIPDVPGNKKHQTIGMLIALSLALLNFLFIQMALQVNYLVVPVLAVLTLVNSFISVYGFRASLISFSGLLAMVLSFAHPHTGIDVYINLLYVACGGGWYLLLALLLNRYRSQSYLAQLINASLERTAEYLELRSQIYLTDHTEGTHLKILELETAIVNDHQSIRDNLLHQRGRSGYQGHKKRQFLVFIELVQILELASGNPIDFSKYRDKSAEFREIVIKCAEVIKALGERLDQLSQRKRPEKAQANQKLDNLFKKALEQLEQYTSEKAACTEEHSVILSNLLDYTQKQLNNVKAISRYLITDKPLKKPSLKRKDRDLFVSVEEYSPRILIENLSVKSPIFKHCLRLTFTVLTGYLLGSLFSVQNAYWIILTIVVIMRPGYVLTKNRSKDRAIGTLIGGAIALGILFLTRDTTIFAILAFISLTLAFSLIQQNYKVAAVFITLTLIFVYALITPDAFAVIQYRVLDTVIGVFLAAMANYFLWPAWENQTIDQLVADSVSCNRDYLEEVDQFYRDTDSLRYSYKASRKKAFLSMGNLHAGYQRMIQEPQAQQKSLGPLYEVVVTNHDLLTSIASLGTFIQIHKTTKASTNYGLIINTIKTLLEYCEKLLQEPENQNRIEIKYPEKSHRELEDQYKKLLNKDIYKSANPSAAIAQGERVKEARVLLDQLNWIYEVAQNLQQALRNYLKNRN